MKASLENKMIFFNEVMVSAYIYVLMILTDFFSETNHLRENCGWGLILIMALTISVNFAKFSALLMQKLYLKCKSLKLKKHPNRKPEVKYEYSHKKGNKIIIELSLIHI